MEEKKQVVGYYVHYPGRGEHLPGTKSAFLCQAAVDGYTAPGVHPHWKVTEYNSFSACSTAYINLAIAITPRSSQGNNCSDNLFFYDK